MQNFYLGNTYFKMGDHARATECWEKVLELIHAGNLLDRRS